MEAAAVAVGCAQRQMPGDMAICQGRATRREKLDEEVRQGKARRASRDSATVAAAQGSGRVADAAASAVQYVQCGAVSVAQGGSIVGGDWGGLGLGLGLGLGAKEAGRVGGRPRDSGGRRIA